MLEKTRLIVEHYKMTAQATFRLWQQRNTTFIVLVAVIGLALLITVAPKLFFNLLLTYAYREAALVDTHWREFAASVPFTIIQVALMVAVFYLMVNLYHRHASIIRNYAYLGLVEQEVRRDLGLAEKDIAFTRESGFYFENQTFILRVMKGFYALILGGVLLAYFAIRLWSDFESENLPLLAVDGAIAAATLAVFLGYLTLRKPKRLVHGG